MNDSSARPLVLLAVEQILQESGFESEPDWVSSPVPHWSYRHGKRTAIVALAGSDGVVTLRFRDIPQHLEANESLSIADDYFAGKPRFHKWAISLPSDWERDGRLAALVVVLLHDAFGESSFPLSVLRHADRLLMTRGLVEGAVRTVTLTTYERSEFARQACIEYWGTQCCVCGFDFEETYGEIGRGYIHVHHLVPLSAIGDEHEVNPITDLRPVCPNCHHMLHKREPPLSPDELQAKLRSGRC